MTITITTDRKWADISTAPELIGELSDCCHHHIGDGRFDLNVVLRENAPKERTALEPKSFRVDMTTNLPLTSADIELAVYEYVVKHYGKESFGTDINGLIRGSDASQQS